MSIIPEGRVRIRGKNGQPDSVAVELDGTSEVWTEAEYRLAGGRPPFESLKRQRDQLPSLPPGALDDWEADRGPGAVIDEIYKPDVRADGSGTVCIDWRRQMRHAELQRYKEGADTPTWIFEIEKILAPDICKVAATLDAANPKTETDLAAALDGLGATRNWDRDRI